MAHFLKTLAGALLMGAAALTPSVAEAGNQDGFWLSDDAALMAGAVVSTTRDAGSIWYNPAGLAQTDRRRIDITANAYVLRFYEFDEYLQTDFGGDVVDTMDLDFLEYVSVPNVVGYSFRVSDAWVVSGALLVQEYRETELRASRQILSEEALREAEWGFEANTLRKVYWVGPAAAWSATSRLRLGASLLVAYFAESGSEVASIATSNDPSTGLEDFLLVVGEQGSSKTVGVLPVVGVQWDAGAGWALGANLRGPVFSVWSATDADFWLATGADGQVAYERTPVEDSEVKLELMRPPRLDLGASWTNSRWTVALSTDISGPLDSDTGEYESVVNVRVGARWWAAPTFALGAGLHTDFDHKVDEGDVDFVGGTAGVQIATPYELADGDSIRFVTTASVNIEVGFGEVESYRLSAKNEGPELQQSRSDVSIAQAGLYLGGGIEF